MALPGSSEGYKALAHTSFIPVDLNDLCEPPSHASRSGLGTATGNPAAADYDGTRGFFSGLLLKVEAKLRIATAALTDHFGPFTLPCLFIAAGGLGAAAAAASFKARMRISSNPELRAGVHTGADRSRAANAAALHTRPPSPTSLSAIDKNSKLGNFFAHSHDHINGKTSLVTSELPQKSITREIVSATDDEKEVLLLKNGSVSATELFSSKELTVLFVLPAAVVASVLVGSWALFKHQCGINNVRLPHVCAPFKLHRYKPISSTNSLGCFMYFFVVNLYTSAVGGSLLQSPEP